MRWSTSREREFGRSYGPRPTELLPQGIISAALVSSMRDAGFGLKVEPYSDRVHGVTPIDGECFREFQAHEQIRVLGQLFDRDINPREHPEVLEALARSTFDETLQFRLVATALKFRADRLTGNAGSSPLHREANGLLPTDSEFLTHDELKGLVEDIVAGSVTPPKS